MLTRFDFERAFVASELGPSARHVLHVLAMRLDKDTFAIPHRYQPSLTDLARDMGCNRRTAMRRLNRVEAAGWIVRDRPTVHEARTKHVRTKYRLRLPPGHPLAGGENDPDLAAESLQAGGRKPPALETGRSEAGGKKPLKSSTSDGSSPSDVDVIIEEIQKRTGRPTRRSLAALVRDELLSKARGTPRDVQAYLRACIEREPHPERWLPTPQPPSSRDLIRHGSYPEETT